VSVLLIAEADLAEENYAEIAIKMTALMLASTIQGSGEVGC